MSARLNNASARLPSRARIDGNMNGIGRTSPADDGYPVPLLSICLRSLSRRRTSKRHFPEVSVERSFCLRVSGAVAPSAPWCGLSRIDPSFFSLPHGTVKRSPRMMKYLSGRSVAVRSSGECAMVLPMPQRHRSADRCMGQRIRAQDGPSPPLRGICRSSGSSGLYRPASRLG